MSMFKSGDHFFQATPEELMFESVSRGYRRYVDRMKVLEEEGIIRDPKIDVHWIAVCVSHVELQPLMEALENGGPEVQPLLEELRRGMEGQTFIDQVGQG